MNSEKLLIYFTADDLRAIIREVVGDCLLDYVAGNQIGSPGEENPREGSDFLDKKQAAKLIQCSVSTIDNLARAGALRRYRIGKKSVRFDKAEVLSVLKTSKWGVAK